MKVTNVDNTQSIGLSGNNQSQSIKMTNATDINVLSMDYNDLTNKPVIKRLVKHNGEWK